MKKNVLLLLSVVMTGIIVLWSCEKISSDKTPTLSEQYQLKDDLDFDPNAILNALCFNPKNVDLERICTDDYTPVCACETITFGNACTAESYGFSNYTSGACFGTPCRSKQVKDLLYDKILCSDEPNYVCGCDGITYRNVCEATINGVLRYTPGRCNGGLNLDSLRKQGCYDPTTIDPFKLCPRVIDPVCACGVIQFRNGCEARMFGFQNYERGSCLSNRCKVDNLPSVYLGLGMTCAPNFTVCGCDGETYPSPCHATTNGVLLWTPGPCGKIPIRY